MRASLDVSSNDVLANVDLHGESERRGGAVIIIVLALMAALAFLGFFFYEFTVFERTASGRFADVGVEASSEFDPTPYFDDALEQLVVGTRDTRRDSVLWGNKYSLVGNLVGIIDPDGLVPNDVVPHNGAGIRIRFRDEIDDANGGPGKDGVPDNDANTDPNLTPDEVFFQYGTDTTVFNFNDDTSLPLGANSRPIFNFSRVAHPSNVAGGATHSPLPPPFRTVGVAPVNVDNFAPDAGYTYPDINSMFLAYESEYHDALFGRTFDIYVPSFFRPQYFVDRRDRFGAFATRTFGSLYTDATVDKQTGDSRALVLRPHSGHRRFDFTGADAGPRFLAADDFARSGDTSRTLPAFVFNIDPDGDGNANETGVWNQDAVNDPQNANWELDVDTDNDGIADAILMDLDMPLVTFENGEQAIPLAAFKVMDADALFNLNVHGNAYGLERVTRSRSAAPSVPIVDHAQFPGGPPGNPTSIARNQTLDVWAADRANRLFGSPINGSPDLDSVSASGLGRSHYEVNPTYGLSAWSPNFYDEFLSPWDSSTALPHAAMFGDLTGRRTTFSDDAVHTELANMEFAMLLFGNTGGDGTQRISGRHGESSLFATATVGGSRRLQPIVNGTIPAANSIVPGAGNSYTNDARTDDDSDHIQYDMWLDQNDDGLFSVVEADRDFNSVVEEANARSTGDAYNPIAFDNDLRVPGDVHPGSSLAVADPFVDQLQSAPLQRTLELVAGRNGLGTDSAARWPGYADSGRFWYQRNYPAIAASLGLTHAGFLRSWARVAGVVPYLAGAAGLSGFDRDGTAAPADPVSAAVENAFTNDEADLFDLVNEEDEQFVGEPGVTYQGDDLFPPSEMAALHLSNGDFRSTEGVSRVQALAPINFANDPNASSIRRVFTTESNDRLELAIGYHVSRPWEFNRWEFIEDPANPGNALVPGILQSFGAAASGGIRFGPIGRISGMFPPVFADARGATPPAANDDIPDDTTTNAGANAILAYSPVDPFRDVLRTTLATARFPRTVDNQPNPFAVRNFGVFDGSTASRNLRVAARKKLRLDGVLASIDVNTGEPIYRPLTPHPDLSRLPFSAVTQADLRTATAILANVTGPHEIAPVNHFSLVVNPRAGDSANGVPALVTAEATTAARAAASMEYWARQDRQDLARDIYVLLYTMCGPEGWDPTTQAPSAALAAIRPQVENHVRLAAQFAVNIVDAMDSDSVITEFSYDADLSNGWDTTLATAGSVDGSVDSTDRLSVYGVEAASLSVSEVLLARTQQFSSDLPDTSWNDSFSRQFGFVELRNSSPFDVRLTDNSWRLEVVYDAPSGIPNPVTASSVLEFQENNSGDFNTIRAGGNFLIGDTGDASITDSMGRTITAAVVDLANSGNPQDVILPAVVAPSVLPTVPLVDLDLANARLDHAGDLSNGGAGRGMVELIGPIYQTPPANTTVERIVAIPRDDGSGTDKNDPGEIHYTARLYRRPNLNDPQDALNQPRWVLVDELVHLSRPQSGAAGDSEVLDMHNTAQGDVNTDSTGGTYGTDDLLESWFSTERSEPFGRLAGPVGFATDTELGSGVGGHQPGKGYGPPATQPSPTSADTARNHSFDTDDTIGSGKKHWGNTNLVQEVIRTASGEFSRWQPHFDRRFVSDSELLSVPLFGSVTMTQTPPNGTVTTGEFELDGVEGDIADGPDQADGAEDTVFRQMMNFTPTAGLPTMSARRPNDSVSRPDPNLLSGYLGEPPSSTHANHWHRLFDFFGVPPVKNGSLEKLEAETGVPQFRPRTPGKINTNTLRNAEVLAGLIDEPIHLDPLNGIGIENNANARHNRSNDRLNPAVRNWWSEFLRARDSVDAFTNIPLPGIPGSRPFEPASRLVDLEPQIALERTRLRGSANYVGDRNNNLDLDSDDFRESATVPFVSAEERVLGTMGLFDARTIEDADDDGTDDNVVDPWTRNRLLAKVMNNSTDRSNVFVVWVAIQLHHADHGFRATDGAPDLEDVRIGGVMEDMPIYRTFCVVDRSLLEQAYEDPDPTDGVPGTFDFRKFILHRQRLR